jgi:hypothetical protein
MGLRKPVWIGIILGAIGVFAVGWTILNQPLATGRVLTGTVIYCGEQQKSESSWCMIRLDLDSRTVPVDMAREYPGQQISLIEMRRRLTGRTYYLVRGRDKP